MSAQRHVEQSLFPEIKPDRPVGYIVPSTGSPSAATSP